MGTHYFPFYNKVLINSKKNLTFRCLLFKEVIGYREIVMRQFSLEEYLANPSKKVVTRNGRNVKIHCTNCVGTYPIVAEIEGSGESILFTEKGELCVGYDLKKDLFFATEKHEGWINLYLDSNHITYSPGALVFMNQKKVLRRQESLLKII